MVVAAAVVSSVVAVAVAESLCVVLVLVSVTFELSQFWNLAFRNVPKN